LQTERDKAVSRNVGNRIQIKTKGVRETMAIGKTLGRHLSPGDVICLTGELGTGKTCLVKGLAEGLGIKGEIVTSPTFIIIREYKGSVPLYHIDLYRIGVVEDIRDIGMEEVVFGSGVTAIEWAERIRDRLPDERIDITLKWVDEKTRDIEMKAMGPHHRKVLKVSSEDLRTGKG
jgi:tRNA threonylcarbamoyladenosine biosynthesis protein TsaE